MSEKNNHSAKCYTNMYPVQKNEHLKWLMQSQKENQSSPAALREASSDPREEEEVKLA